MKVGIIGLGKLGLPVAVAISREYEVVGYDLNSKNLLGPGGVGCSGAAKVTQYRYQELGPYLEDDFQYHLENANLKIVSHVKDVAEECDIIFLAIQTPHDPLYEGITRIPTERADFNYQYLVQATKDVLEYIKPEQVLVIISTVLPGTIRREIAPLTEGKCGVVYNPFFIAMGTTMYDFLNPEFVLLGCDDKAAMAKVMEFYKRFHHEELFASMSIESAELTKVAYNTYISFKIGFANTLMEICQKIPGCDVDSVTNTLARANRRIMSAKYMRAGMGDGGGCHPRDNIAMSWLAQKLDLSYDIFDAIMHTREKQAEWLVKLMRGYDLPKVILGKTFKPETRIITGSPAILCANLLKETDDCLVVDPKIDGPVEITEPSVILVATRHECFRQMQFPKGSVVIDPFRYLHEQDGVKIISLGRTTLSR